MDFSNILGYLQNLMTNKQGMQSSEFGSNLDLQNRSLAQGGSQFDEQLKQQGSQFDADLALRRAAQQFSQGFSEQQLAQAADQFNKQYGMSLSAQQFAQKMAEQNNVVPGSAKWFQMQGAGGGGATGGTTAAPKTYGVDMIGWNKMFPTRFNQ